MVRPAPSLGERAILLYLQHGPAEGERRLVEHDGDPGRGEQFSHRVHVGHRHRLLEQLADTLGAACSLMLLSFCVNGAHGVVGGAASMDFGGRKGVATAAGETQPHAVARVLGPGDEFEALQALEPALGLGAHASGHVAPDVLLLLLHVRALPLQFAPPIVASGPS